MKYCVAFAFASRSLMMQRIQEAVSAYKDIEQEMAFQADLVKIKVELSPLAVIKG